jgi:hypothetical protein
MSFRSSSCIFAVLVAAALPARAEDASTRFKIEPASHLVAETVLRWRDGQEHAVVTFKSPADAARMAHDGLIARLFVVDDHGRPIDYPRLKAASDPCDWYLSYIFSLDPAGRPLDFGPIDRQWLGLSGGAFTTGHFVLVFHYKTDVADDNDMFGLNRADTDAFFGLDKPGNAIAIAVEATPATDQSNAYGEIGARQQSAYGYVVSHRRPRCHSLHPIAAPALEADAGAPALCGVGDDPAPRVGRGGIVQLDLNVAGLL